MTNQKKVALALGGGGARGIAHIHVLKAFDDLGVTPAAISGSSIGAIVGAGYASGMSGADIEELLLGAFGNRTAVFASLWKLRPQPLRAFSGAVPFGQMDIEMVLETFLPETFPHTFDELSVPLSITATDYYGNALKVLDTGDLRKAVAASAAIPVVFVPVIIDGCVLIDGGINNPLPFDLLDSAKYRVVAVDVVGLPMGTPGKLPSRIDSAFGASQLMMQSITGLKLRTDPPDLFLRPKVDAYRVLDFLKVREILAETAPVYEEAKRGLERLLEADTL
ncbi:patatin-like phospholipase family protein [Salaquimonas pukyongi]|uniref:patatin-like phospholipase family protein n=1 Tax=Salaquimonas pukyongi TaxID=2712698 RepID=UPI00096B8C12|nr:patatin-like phospholipase family protein [Salaquimonas pukyongi]